MTEDVEKRAKIYRFTRAFVRRAAFGMQVRYGRTVNPSIGVTVEHFELAMPGYICTANGPEIIDIDDVEVAYNEE